jgi:hypothetical protein
MSQFELFNQALAAYKNIIITEESPHKTLTTCQHSDIITEMGVVTCLSCGEEILHTINHEKEWRYYGASDSRRSSDPNRVQIRKTEERNINKDVQNMGFSEKIVTRADELYEQVTKGQIYRGNSRKAIVFACIFHAYKLSGKHQTPDNLVKLFGLTRKNGLHGLKMTS